MPCSANEYLVSEFVINLFHLIFSCYSGKFDFFPLIEGSQGHENKVLFVTPGNKLINGENVIRWKLHVRGTNTVVKILLQKF